MGLEEVLITAIGGRPVGGPLAGFCMAVLGLVSGEARTVVVIGGAGRPPQTVRVVFE